MKVLEEQVVTIRAEATTLVISEGTNGDGQLYRAANAAFSGKDSQATIDSFIASMR